MRPGSTASGDSRTTDSVSSTVKNSRSRGRVHEHLVDEADEFLELADQQAGEIHEHHDVADGGAALEMQAYADHEDPQHGQRGGRPGQHRDHGPPRQHRDLRREQIVGDGAQPRDFRLDAGEALHQGDVCRAYRRRARRGRNSAARRCAAASPSC